MLGGRRIGGAEGLVAALGSAGAINGEGDLVAALAFPGTREIFPGIVPSFILRDSRLNSSAFSSCPFINICAS
jgi:hypothetical protein